MKLESRLLGDWQVLVPDQTRLDAYVAEELKQCLLRSLAEGPHQLILDLGRVEFMDSSGLGALVYCLQRMEESGRIALSGAREAVAMMLRLTHMDKVFLVIETPEDILQSTT